MCEPNAPWREPRPPRPDRPSPPAPHQPRPVRFHAELAAAPTAAAPVPIVTREFPSERPATEPLPHWSSLRTGTAGKRRESAVVGGRFRHRESAANRSRQRSVLLHHFVPLLVR